MPDKEKCAPTQQLEAEKKASAKKHFDVAFYHDWCKVCGICMAFCPKKIILADKVGKPMVEEPDNCIGCRFCEIHCPDFAITVNERRPKRRKDDV
ncbi:MAG: 4Fe-4S dicluster domain-containing protein [Desulfobulbus sp.]|nr:4Fe-4S dicluster domain-containing protein [Desulfobulbus sp.]